MGFADGVNARTGRMNAGTSYMNAETSRMSAETQREALRQQAEQRNQELMKQGYSFDGNQMKVRPNSAAEAEQLQAQEAAQLAKALQGKLAAQDTDRAFEDYSLTGDANYLQSALDNNPVLKNAWAKRGVQLVSNIDFNADTTLLSNAGLPTSAYDTAEKQNILKRNLFKVYDGKDWGISVANQAVAETGALKRMGNRRAEPIINNYKEMYSLLNGPKVDPTTAEGHKYEKEIIAAADKYNLHPNLLAAQIHAESTGDSSAVSGKGARGLMQLMPDTAKELGVTDIHDPAQNIEGGAKYMRKLLDKYKGNIKLALAAYNAGPGNVDKYGGIPPFGETQKYVQKVIDNLDQAESYYGSDAENVTNTILNHYRALALAKEGKTPQNEDQLVRNDTQQVANRSRELDQGEISLDLKRIDQFQKDEELRLKDKEIEVKAKADGTTAKQKDLMAGDVETQNLTTMFGGEDKFWQTDFTDPKNYRKAWPVLNKIETLQGVQLSEADKKSITDQRQLIALADPAIKLTGAETGLYDSTLGDLEKYFSDNVGGVAAKSAYSAFRNSVRNALFGSALTEGEIKAFDQAYGTLGNKLGPALEMFQTSLLQVQAKLDSTANLMSPYSAKIRLGADQEKLVKIRDALQARIDYVKGLQNGGKTQEEKKNRKPLDQIFGAN